MKCDITKELKSVEYEMQFLSLRGRVLTQKYVS